LKVCDGDVIRMGFKDAHTAALLEEEDCDSSYKYIITPINIVA
jgi:DNA polymerase III sliding clamp (beta) subunit (PCNA family)